MHCQYCDSDDHPWFNCRKRPDGWKPPKKLGEQARQVETEVNRSVAPAKVAQATIAERASVDSRSLEATIASPSKSTAALKEVHGSVRMTPGSAPQPEPQDRIGGLGNDPQAVSLPTGTQAPSVDTKFDKVAYQRDYMRKRRAIAKAKSNP